MYVDMLAPSSLTHTSANLSVSFGVDCVHSDDLGHVFADITNLDWLFILQLYIDETSFLPSGTRHSPDGTIVSVNTVPLQLSFGYWRWLILEHKWI